MPEKQTDQSEREQRWFAPLLFWFCLLISAILFGSVLLTPKILSWTKLQYDYHNNQIELVELENQVQYLKRVAEALENDPLFNEELARVEFHAEEPDTESLPVRDSLNPILNLKPPVTQKVSVALPWYLPILEAFQQHPHLKHLFLLTASLIAIFAFTLLPQPVEAVKEYSLETAKEENRSWMKQRYRKDD